MPLSDRDSCGDCGVREGAIHEDGCDMESCAFCGGQRISCGCSAKHFYPSHRGVREELPENFISMTKAERAEFVGLPLDVSAHQSAGGCAGQIGEAPERARRPESPSRAALDGGEPEEASVETKNPTQGQRAGASGRFAGGLEGNASMAQPDVETEWCWKQLETEPPPAPDVSSSSTRIAARSPSFGKQRAR